MPSLQNSESTAPGYFPRTAVMKACQRGGVLKFEDAQMIEQRVKGLKAVCPASYRRLDISHEGKTIKTDLARHYPCPFTNGGVKHRRRAVLIRRGRRIRKARHCAFTGGQRLSFR